MKFFVVFLLVASALFGSAAKVQAQLYDVRTSTTNFERKERDAVKVQVEGTAAWTRDFWQSWLKDTYNIRVKGGGVLGLGKSDLLVAKQTPASSVSGKLIDLYSTVTSPSDSTSELSVWAAFGPDTFLSPDKNATEFAALRTITQSFASAARLKAYREQIAEAEKQLKEAEKEKEKLEKERTSLQASTTSNLARIEALKQQNISNTLKAREDSVKLVSNAQQLDLRKLRLQRKRDRMTGLERK
ncbi:hypothetical protein SAMN02745146_1366 [Hymenobacter daecheongensis DSM 21074]|uniref:DUF4398 domain-containing protein n=1 Tax=Hymenobacter daecheongensis DSM 21074 TaxID=1121955 RepID=A0A1M6D3Q0_9BACT|nr:hypothetical protein [Hymenobacter daecheongensis]SHI67880.1 hypothetical protein SAMN02745146_1366 [Hymenobacter daecheongensis DSM 21074]